MTKPFLLWSPPSGASGNVVTAVRDFPGGKAVVLSDSSKSTVFLAKEGETSADQCVKVVRKEPVKVVDAAFSSNLWKLVVLYEDFVLYLVEPSNGRIFKKFSLKQGLNKASVATSLAMHSNGSLITVGYTLDLRVGKKAEKKKKQANNDDDDDPISYCIDVIDLRSPDVPVKCYEDLHSATIQALQFSPTMPNILMTGGADGLVNWVDTSTKDVDDGLLATENPLSPVATVGFVGGDSEGRTLAFATTDDGRAEFYRIVGSSVEEFDVEVTFKRNPSERFLVDITGNSSPKLPFVVVESTKDGRVALTATSGDGKFCQTVGEFQDHQDLVRCVQSAPSQRQVLITGDEAGCVVGRKFSEVADDKIEETTETMEQMEVNGALAAAKSKKRKVLKRKAVKQKMSTVKTGKIAKNKSKTKAKRKTVKKVRKVK